MDHLCAWQSSITSDIGENTHNNNGRGVVLRLVHDRATPFPESVCQGLLLCGRQPVTVTAIGIDPPVISCTYRRASFCATQEYDTHRRAAVLQQNTLHFFFFAIKVSLLTSLLPAVHTKHLLAVCAAYPCSLASLSLSPHLITTLCDLAPRCFHGDL